jgi:uncharacterized repeat protein (TIGR03803 family)
VKRRPNLPAVHAVLLTLIVTSMFALSASAASSYKQIYAFGGHNGGSSPLSGLVFDTAGNLYGTTSSGGAQLQGVVFKLTNSGGAWTESLLHTFTGGTDGGYPVGSLIFDGAGNLYGTAVKGGNATCDCGVVFKLTPQSGGSWTYSVLYTFSGSDGSQPEAGVILDSAGNLYGTTIYGGGASCSCGVVFKLTPQSGGSWTESLLYTFTDAADGGYPGSGQLVFDHAGNLYGTASGGGSGDNGVVFELTPSSGASWTQTVLHTFAGSDGSLPYASVIFDGSGNLYGTTVFGGDLSDCLGGGCGVVFELTPDSGGGWTESVLHEFLGSPALQPFANLVFDVAGNLYSTATGGVTDGGAVFKLTPQSGGTWAYSVLHAFTAKPGENPYSNLILDHAGNLYGTSYQCGVGYKCAGLAFEITP